MNTEKATAATSAKKTPGLPLGKRITHFLVSMKLALTLLFVIAILSIMGTILPQGDVVLETDWVNNPLYDFYKTLGLFDMYNSWWFLSILVLLIANLSVCITKRLPTALKHFLKPRVDVKDIFVTKQPVSATLPGQGNPGIDRARSVLSAHRYHIRTGTGGSVLAEKGRFSPLASIAFHLSFLFIGIGAISTSLLGFDERVEVPDGRTVAVPNTSMRVKNNRFNVEYAEVVEDGRVTGYRPSVYSSDLEVSEGEEVLGAQTITVNDPLRVEGVNFHQASFYRTNRGYVTVLQVNSSPGKSLIYIGFFLMMGGISAAIYFPHRRIWLKAGESGDLLLGGRSNRSKVTFQREFERILAELRLKPGQEARQHG